MEFLHIPRYRKKLADVLSNLASICALPVIIEKKKAAHSIIKREIQMEFVFTRKGSFEENPHGSPGP